MLYHFEFRGEQVWEAFGSGEGSGPEALTLALGDLLELAGGRLPAGEYRCIGATSAATRWDSLWLEEDGRVLLDPDPVPVAG